MRENAGSAPAPAIKLRKWRRENLRPSAAIGMPALATRAPTCEGPTIAPNDWVISGVSVGLLTAGAVSPRVGRAIGKWGGRRVLALSAVLLAAGLSVLG